MIKAILKHIALLPFAVILSTDAIPAQTKADCTSFNTYSFFFDNFDEDTFIHCVYFDDGSLNLIQDESGSIPIFKALFSDIPTSYFNDFFHALNDETLETLINTRDKYGDSLLEIATEVGSLDIIELILSFGVPADQVASESTIRASFGESIEATVLDARIADGALDVASILKIAGAIATVDLDLEYSTELALFYPERWSDVNFRKFRSTITKEAQGSAEFCDSIVEPSVLESLSVHQFKVCFDESSKIFFANYFNNTGESYLHLLSRYAQDPLILDYYIGSFSEDQREILLARKSADNYKPIHTAVRFSEEPEIMSRLVGWGANINEPVAHKYGVLDIKRRNWKTSPMHLLANREDIDPYWHLISAIAHGADANAQDDIGNTPQHIFLSRSETDLASLSLLNFSIKRQKGLLSLGATEKQNDKGATPLLYAVSKKRGTDNDNLSEESIRHFLIIEDLLAFGADPDKADNNGWSPLIYYANFGNDADVFDDLLQNSDKACKAKTSEGVSVLAALNNNASLKNSEVSYDTEVRSPIGLLNQKCQGL